MRTVASEVLRGNPLGDPSEREVRIYEPPGFDAAERYPVLLALVGFGGTGAALFNADPFGEDLASRMDRLITSRACPPALVVAPDCFTRLGGNQYLNSTATGAYEDYLTREIVPFVDGEYRTRTRGWGVFGKSSGGYGAMVLGMRNPDVFGALADHSGDANFELCYMGEFPDALDAFRRAGGAAKWLERFWGDINRRRRKYMKPLNALAMAAHYSPNPDAPELGIDFPFDLQTGAFRPDVWERWRAWDPVNMVEHHVDNLRRLKLIFIDCGDRDEFSLHWGARALSGALTRHGIDHHHETFDDGHMSISYRYDRSIPRLVRALTDDGAPA